MKQLLNIAFVCIFSSTVFSQIKIEYPYVYTDYHDNTILQFVTIKKKRIPKDVESIVLSYTLIDAAGTTITETTTISRKDFGSPVRIKNPKGLLSKDLSIKYYASDPPVIANPPLFEAPIKAIPPSAYSQVEIDYPGTSSNYKDNTVLQFVTIKKNNIPKDVGHAILTYKLIDAAGITTTETTTILENEFGSPVRVKNPNGLVSKDLVIKYYGSTLPAVQDLLFTTPISTPPPSTATVGSTFKNIWILSPNVGIPMVRANVIKSGSSDAKMSASSFNSISVGFLFESGQVTTKTNDVIKDGDTFLNMFGFGGGVMFSVTNTSTTTGSSTGGVIAPFVTVSLLDFQIYCGYDFGTVPTNFNRTFFGVSYGLSLGNFGASWLVGQGRQKKVKQNLIDKTAPTDDLAPTITEDEIWKSYQLQSYGVTK